MNLYLALKASGNQERPEAGEGLISREGGRDIYISVAKC